MAVVVSVAVVFIMGAVIVLAADSSHSLALGWRVRGEGPLRYKINYSSQCLVFGFCYEA